MRLPPGRILSRTNTQRPTIQDGTQLLRCTSKQSISASQPRLLPRHHKPQARKKVDILHLEPQNELFTDPDLSANRLTGSALKYTMSCTSLRKPLVWRPPLLGVNPAYDLAIEFLTENRNQKKEVINRLSERIRNALQGTSLSTLFVQTV
jgi:hypothetical protein